MLSIKLQKKKKNIKSKNEKRIEKLTRTVTSKGVSPSSSRSDKFAPFSIKYLAILKEPFFKFQQWIHKSKLQIVKKKIRIYPKSNQIKSNQGQTKKKNCVSHRASLMQNCAFSQTRHFLINVCSVRNKKLD